MYYTSKPPVLIFGGSGALGRVLTDRFLRYGSSVVVFSRDEAKHHYMRSAISGNVEYVIGDIRDYDSVLRTIKKYRPIDIINAAAMKQVPACEFYPYEALQTNTIGAHNLVRAVQESDVRLRKCLSISTDKACKPVNSYGMTKSLQERIHLNANGESTVFNCVRYGNVLNSTGSVIPFFNDRILKGKNLPITDKNMTRFLMSLDQAVDLIFEALKDWSGGKIYVPKVPSANMFDLARVMLKNLSPGDIDIEFVGIRPGEKIHEVLVSEEEITRTESVDDLLVIHDIKKIHSFNDLDKEYSSRDNVMTFEELEDFCRKHDVI